MIIKKICYDDLVEERYASGDHCNIVENRYEQVERDDIYDRIRSIDQQYDKTHYIRCMQ